jgi:hypothetical protein
MNTYYFQRKSEIENPRATKPKIEKKSNEVRTKSKDKKKQKVINEKKEEHTLNVKFGRTYMDLKRI